MSAKTAKLLGACQLGFGNERSSRSRSSTHRRGWIQGTCKRRQLRGRVHRGGLRRVRDRGPADRSGRRRVLPAHVDGEPTLIDCFFAVPTEPLGEIDQLTVDFGSSTQSYHVGEGSVAVPGLLAGLVEAHAALRPARVERAVAPAIELARTGVDVSPAQAFLHEILVAVLQRDEGGRRIYGNVEHLDTEDSSRRSNASATIPTRPCASWCPSSPTISMRTGRSSASRCAPTIGGREVVTTPPPSRGGAIVASVLAGFAGASVARRPCARPPSRRTPATPYGGIAGTTHVSVVDARRERRRALLDARLRLRRPSRRNPAEQHARRVRRDRPRREDPGRAAGEHDDADARARGRASRG